MKAIFRIIISLIILTGFSFSGFSQATLTIGTVTGISGNSVSIPVLATGITDMTKFQFTITYDKTKLAYTGNSNWSGGTNSAEVQITQSDGAVTFVYSGAAVNIASGKFFDLNFTVLIGTSGSAPVTWSDTQPQLLTNSESVIISCTYTSGVVNITDPPPPPIVGPITQPTCSLATGSVVLSGLPASGSWILTRSPGNIPTNGTGTETTISELPVGTYTYTVTNAAGITSLPSGEVIINLQPPTPNITNQSTTILTGTTFTIIPTGVPEGTTYTWTDPTYTGLVSGGSAQTIPQTSISGTLTIPSGSGTAAYTVTPVAGSCTGSTFTVTITVTFNCLPVEIVTQPSANSMCVITGNTSFTVAANGTPPFNYIWEYNNNSGTWSAVTNGTPAGAIYSTAGTSTLGVSGITLPRSYQYRCYITNCSAASSSTSNVVTLTVTALPAAPLPGTLTQPTCSVATGSVVLSGLPASGNWTITRIPGGITTSGSGTSTTISGLTAGTYTFTVTDVSGCISPASANVIINSQPVTPVVPNQVALIQTGGTFTVTPSGVPPGTTYTWTIPQYTGGVTGGNAQSIPQTSISGTLSITSGTGTAIYTVTPQTGSCIGTPFSVTVTVSFDCVPVTTIVTQPQDKSMCATSGNASFTVNSNGTPPFTYQWEYYNSGTWSVVTNGIPAGASYSNLNTNTLGVSGITTTGSYQFRCSITNCSSASNAKSNAATLTVNASLSAPVPEIPTQPTCTLATGSVVLIGLPSSGIWTLTRNQGGIITTGTGTSSTISGLTEGTYSFTVNITGGCISDASSDVIINSQPPTPVVTDQTASIETGETFTVTPVGTPPGTAYTWSDPVYTGEVTGGSAQTIPQPSISGSLTIPSGSGTAVYTVTPVTGSCTGNTFTLTVTVTSSCVPVTIGNQPSDISMCATTGDASFTVISNGTPPFNYQWQYYDGADWTNVSNDLPIGASYSNTETGTLGVSGITTAGSYLYRCIITNCTSISITTNDATLTVYESQTAPIPGTTLQPTCSLATGSVELNGLPSSGTWILTRNPGGINITGTGTSTTISGLIEGTYSFFVKNDNGCISPLSSDVTINSQPPSPVVTNQTVTIQTGEPFTVTPAGTPPGTTYTWSEPVYTSGVTGGSAQTIPQTSISGVLTIPIGSGTATYTVTPVSGSCVGAQFTVTVNVSYDCVPVSIQTQPLGTSICSVFDEASFTVVARGTSPSYQWQYLNGSTWVNVTNETPAGAIYVNSSTATLGASGFISAGNYQYRCNIKNCTSNSINSSPVTLIIYESPASPVPEAPVQPTCTVATGSVVAGGLPSSGTWTLTRNPGNIIITGTGTTTLISGLIPRTYYFTVTNANGCVSSASADVIINTQPPIPNVANQTATIQSGETFNVTPTGQPPGTTYTWTTPVYTGAVSGGSAQTNPQSSIFGTLTITSGSGTAIYTVTPVAGSCTGAPFTVTVNVTTACIPATISTQPSPRSFCAVTGGESFTVVATGTAPHNYQWQYNNGGIWTNVLNGIPAGASYSDQNSPVLGVSGISAHGIYQYSCYITNCTSGSVRSNAATLTVNGVPTIPVAGTITQPTCSSPTGSIVLSGLPASGTWTLTRNPDGVITTGTGTSTIISGLVSGIYSFIVTSAAGCISNTLTDVIINTQPPTPAVSDQTTGILSEGTFIVTPFGVPPGTTYTWTAPVYTGEVTGGTAQTIPQTSLTGVLTIPTGRGTATYIVTPVTGSCIGTTFTLTVTVTSTCVPVTIGEQPFDNNMCASSGNASFSIKANGTSPFNYQWQYNNGGLWSLVSNGTPAGAIYSNPTTPNMSVTGISSAGSYKYRCYIINCTSNSVRSNVVTLTVNASPPSPAVGLITQPTCDIPTGSVVLNGLPESGIWTLLRNPGDIISNGTGTSTTISGLAAGTYTFSVSTGSGCYSSASANVTINSPPPQLVVSNQTTSIQSGGTFSITPAGVPGGTTYTWSTPVYTGGVRGGTAQTIPQTSITGTLTILSGSGTAVYTVTPYTGSCPGKPFTSTVTVTFNCIPVTIGNHPLNKNVCPVTGEAFFTVVTGGTTPYTYQWQYNNNGTWSAVSNGVPAGATYSNPTSMTLRVSGITAASNYQYRCYITNCTANTATSNAAILTVYPSQAAPVPGTPVQPTCSLVTGSIGLNGLPSAGSWTITRNPGGITSIGTGTNTIISGLTVGTYTFTVTNSSGCVSNPSSEVVINTNPATPSAPVAGTITQPTCTVTTGSTVLNGLPASGTWTLTRTPGGITTSGNGSSTTITDLSPGTYNYRVTNTSGCASAISANIVINASPKGVVPKIAIKYGDLLICNNVGDSIKSYQWYEGVNPISNARNQYYQTEKRPGSYKVMIIDNNGCSNISDFITISGIRSITAYPNPASVSFAIKLNNISEGRALIRILNSGGNKVMEFRVEALNDELLKEIPVDNLDEGIYFIQVLIDNKDAYYTKIVIAK